MELYSAKERCDSYQKGNLLYSEWSQNVAKTHMYNFDPIKLQFFLVKLGFTGVYIIFLIPAQKHRLWVLIRTASARQF